MRIRRRSYIAALVVAVGTTTAVATTAIVIRDGTGSTPDFRPYRYPAAAIVPSAPVEQRRTVLLDYYRSWKSAFLRQGCGGNSFQVYSPDARWAYVAEAQGYGMVITASMSEEDPNAKEIFDGILRFVLAHPSVNDPDLAAAEQDENCADAAGRDSATDGDMDIAYALLLADRKWGSAGDVDYRALAVKRINAIKRRAVHPQSNLMLLGDWSRQSVGPLYETSRTSDWIVHHLRAFRSATGDDDWGAILAAHQNAIAEIQRRSSPGTGLLPDFVRASGTSVVPVSGRVLESDHDGDYNYNACRTPWRIGLDAITSGDPASLAAALKINSWARTATGGDPSMFGTGYTLQGQRYGAESSNAFWAPLAVAAMVDPSGQDWLDALWKKMAETEVDAENYFGASIQLQVMLILVGYYVPV